LKWMEWSQKLQAISQNGLTYAKDKFDLQRYSQLQEIVAEIISEHSNHNHKKVQNYLSSEMGYATPKIDMRGVVLKEGKILLVKEKADGLWTLPGGWADIYETPSGNIEREVWEESGFEVKAVRLLAVYDRSKHGHFPEYPSYVYKFFFFCEITGGEARPSMETSDVGFFDINDLPELSIARVTEKQIHRMMNLKENLQTEFD